MHPAANTIAAIATAIVLKQALTQLILAFGNAHSG